MFPLSFTTTLKYTNWSSNSNVRVLFSNGLSTKIVLVISLYWICLINVGIAIRLVPPTLRTPTAGRYGLLISENWVNSEEWKKECLKYYRRITRLVNSNKNITNTCCVCVERQNYTPILLEEAKQKMYDYNKISNRGKKNV